MKNEESYNLINYVKVVDESLLKFLESSENISEINSKPAIILNSFNKKLLEYYILENISNKFILGKKNILFNTCMPCDNWRKKENKISKNTSKYIITDDVYIDQLKLNSFINQIFNKLKNKKFNEMNEFKSSIFSNMFFLYMKNVDIFDLLLITENILCNFGSVIKNENFNYIIIKDGNCVFKHGCVVVDGIVDQTRLELIKKEIL